MATPWEDLAHSALDDGSKPITANATNIAKFGTPAVGIVTALLAALLGSHWNLDPQRSSVVIGAAVVVAAVVLGTYFAFASDIRTRGAVSIARFEAIARLAGADAERQAAAAAAEHQAAAAAIQQRLDDTTQANATLTTKLAALEKESETAKAALHALQQRDAEETLAKALEALGAANGGNGKTKSKNKTKT